MIKTLCARENVILRKDKTNDIFIIDFEIKNPKKNISDILNIDNFGNVLKMNEDFIDYMDVNKVDENTVDTFIIIKHFGKDMGLPQKYINFRMTSEVTSTTHSFKSTSIPYEGEIDDDIELVECEYSLLRMNPISDLEYQLHYECKLDLQNEVPIYFQNIIGIMMKKIFINFKKYIEN